MRAVARFLVELSEDPFQREEYQRDPERVIASAGLSEDDRKVLLKKDADVLRGYFGDPEGRPVPKLQMVKHPPGPKGPPPPPPPKPPKKP